MYATRSSCRALASNQTATQISRAVYRFTSQSTQAGSTAIRFGSPVKSHGSFQMATRAFSSTAATRLRDFFPEATEAPHIRKTEAAWPHPEVTEEQMRKVEVASRPKRNMSDRFAKFMVSTLRWGTDLATGYKHTDVGAKDDFGKEIPYRMSERKWLIRFIFLESVAGVPGMVAGMLRHLHSLRRLKRDNGWIETLLEEAYNERMHLLTFLKMSEPGWFMKFMILGAQGVFFNAMFVSYLISPRTCHRFVGYLEEEAVKTYTLALADIEAGRLPKWEKLQAPDIAINYWKMPEGKRSMKDLLLYIRADEAKHREVNHTLGNLDQKIDPNPYVSTYFDPSKPHPTKDISNLRSTGWEREEVL